MRRTMPGLAVVLLLAAGRPAVAEDAAPQPGRVLTAEQFNDSVLYGRTQPGEARAYLISMLQSELRSAQASYSLKAAQVDKVRKAGERDIDQWFETVAKAREKYTKERLAPEQFVYAQMEMTKLRMAPQTDVFGGTSFYRMAVNDVVTADQRRILGDRQKLQGDQELLKAVAAQQPNPAQVQPAPIALRAAVALPAAAANSVQLVTGPNGERLYAVSEQYFDQRVFGNSSITAIAVRRQLTDELAARLRSLAVRCSLTDVQKEKLHLAGRGDMKNWFDRVEDLRPQVIAEPLEQTRYTVLFRQMQTLGSERQGGLFGDGSLFRKTLIRTLGDEQRQQFAVIERESRLDAINRALSSMPQQVGGTQLSDLSRKNIAVRILETCGDATIPVLYAQYVVMLQAAELGDELQSLMSETEWKVFQQQLALARRYEASMRSMGVWPLKSAEEEDEVPRPVQPARPVIRANGGF